MTFKVGIVGCGNIADNHVTSYAALDNVEIVAACDVLLERAQAFASRRGIPHGVTSIAAMKELGVDAISVCTPHPTHEAVVIEAAAHGIHVLCEKPIAISTESAERMIRAAEAAGITLGVVFQRRFWPGAQRIRQAIDDGRIGTPMLGNCSVMLHRGTEYYAADAWRGTWENDGGGALMTQGIHYIDLLQWFMGEAVEVSGQIRTLVLADSIEVEDIAVATISFASGAVATIQATTTASPNLGTRVSVTGFNGATASVREYPEGANGINDLWAVPGEESHVDVFAGGIGFDIPVSEVNAGLLPLHKLQVADFVAAVQDGVHPAVSGREALKSLAIVAAVYESARLGAPVRLSSSERVLQP